MRNRSGNINWGSRELCHHRNLFTLINDDLSRLMRMYPIAELRKFDLINRYRSIMHAEDHSKLRIYHLDRYIPESALIYTKVCSLQETDEVFITRLTYDQLMSLWYHRWIFSTEKGRDYQILSIFDDNNKEHHTHTVCFESVYTPYLLLYQYYVKRICHETRAYTPKKSNDFEKELVYDLGSQSLGEEFYDIITTFWNNRYKKDQAYPFEVELDLFETYEWEIFDISVSSNFELSIRSLEDYRVRKYMEEKALKQYMESS